MDLTSKNAKDWVEGIENNSSASFLCAFECGKLLCNPEQLNLARDIVILVLNQWDKISEDIKPIWSDIAESLGFYPYISKQNINLPSLADKIRIETHHSDVLKDVYMHSEQKHIAELLLQGRNIVLSAPTSFGKSLLIEEIVASLKYHNIVIIQPTLALLDETRLKLKKYSDDYRIIVRTAQKPDESKGNLFLLTAERVMEYENFPKIDYLVIDEFYKLSLNRISEMGVQRTNTLNNAFLRIYNTYKPRFYMLGPNIKGITKEFKEEYSAEFISTDYSLVTCEVESIKTNNEADKENSLFKLLYSLKNEQTLVYCSSPNRVKKLAKKYADFLECCNVEKSQNSLPLIDWINKNVSSRWSVANNLGYRIGVHDGSLPKHIGISIIEYFNNKDLDVLFCTSTIIEGVNTSAKNVVFFNKKKGSVPLDFFDYCNIKGRAGRLMRHYVGKVYNFEEPPAEDSGVIIDIPFSEQDKDTLTDEILINIERDRVKKQVSDKYEALNSIDPDLLAIYKSNGVKITSQQSILKKIEDAYKSGKNQSFTWRRMPDYNTLCELFKLSESCLDDFDCHKEGILSSEQLALLIIKYAKGSTLKQLIKDSFDFNIKKYKKQKSLNNLTVLQAEEILDNTIEDIFKFYRHWVQFKVPKTLRIIDSIQKYVSTKRRVKSGDFLFYVQHLENGGLNENISLLLEFGIPTETVKNLAKIIPPTLHDNELLQYIRNNLNAISSKLTPYEIHLLKRCL